MASPFRALASRLDAFAPAVLSLFRIVFGLLFTVYGTTKLLAWPTGNMAADGTMTGPALPVGSWPYWYAGVIELVCGLLIAAGLFTRAAAFLASGAMAYAYFTAHASASFWPSVNGGELAVLYCFAFFLLVFTGGGSIALDRVLSRGTKSDD